MTAIAKRRKPVQCSLAKVFEGTELPFAETWAEKKYDGLRGIIDVTAGTAVTRTGMDIPNADLIIAELQRCGQFGNMVLDGELLANDWNLSQSIVKTQTLHPERHQLRFHVFDMVSQAEWDAKHSFAALRVRNEMLAWRHGRSALELTILTEHTVLHSMQELNDVLKAHVAAGYEGIMLKDANARYAFKKSGVWLKKKPIKEDDFTIIEAYEGKGRLVGMLGGFVIKLGTIVSEVGTGFTDDQRVALWCDWKNGELIGRICEVHYQELTVDNKLRFPSFYRMRDDKVDI